MHTHTYIHTYIDPNILTYGTYIYIHTHKSKEVTKYVSIHTYNTDISIHTYIHPSYIRFVGGIPTRSREMRSLASSETSFQ